jgi:hypothetical protein
VLVAGHIVTVTQSGDCRLSVAPLSQPFSSSGGAGSATVEAAGGCSWSATSSVPWITLTGPTSGSGGGAIAFAVAPLGVLIAGSLVEGIGFDPTIIILATIAQVLGIVSMLLPGLREMSVPPVETVHSMSSTASDSAD